MKIRHCISSPTIKWLHQGHCPHPFYWGTCGGGY